MKLSIITINLNNAEGLRKTIESVVSQTFTDYEYIVIDGASSDGSVDIIKQYVDKITYWVSEPDNGIFNAMNKGILKATGEYILFLNSGDWFVDKNVVKDFCESNFNEDVISGNIILNHNEIWKTPLKEDLDFAIFYEATLPHPATFIKKELFNTFGSYNENNKIVSDWEFFLKCLVVKNATYNHFDRIISFFDLNGISSQPEISVDIENERESVYKTYLPLFIKSYKKIDEENKTLRIHEEIYKEYMNLKNGKMGFLIHLILFLKNKKLF